VTIRALARVRTACTVAAFADWCQTQGRGRSSIVYRSTLSIVLWTILTVVLVVVALALVLGMGARILPGRRSVGDAQERGFRLWTGFWNKDDADRLR
jgi:hypothetical protein